jgi:hypothetical protein
MLMGVQSVMRVWFESTRNQRMDLHIKAAEAELHGEQATVDQQS